MKSPESIIAEVALITGVPAPVITGTRRTSRVVWARWLAIAAIRKSFNWLSLQDIGDVMNRDYTSISYALKQIPSLLETSPTFRALARELQLLR